MSDPNTLKVFREIAEGFQIVGTITTERGQLGFNYAQEYLDSPNAAPISLSLPLSVGASFQDALFFEGLLPEGAMRGLFANSLHVHPEQIEGLLSNLNNETIGALVLGQDIPVQKVPHNYEPLDFNSFEEFARTPSNAALKRGISQRLSLAGAQSKLGLFHSGDDFLTGWATPIGLSPTTHIVKAADATFPNQMVNEALCMNVARLCDFEVAECSLIKTESAPILAVRRFDRPLNAEGQPVRIHQEDFCQAAGFASTMKYEPTDGHFAILSSRLISDASANPFGDRALFFSELVFHYVIGNCDNHLKNHSFLWSADWKSRELAPLYDVVCTTIYPEISRDMGISLCESRRIDDVTRADILSTSKQVGLPENIAIAAALEVAEAFIPALEQAASDLMQQGFNEAIEVAEAISTDAQGRIAVCRSLA